MKKLYISPDMELLGFYSLSPIGAETGDPFANGDSVLEEEEAYSLPWNNGELGWT